MSRELESWKNRGRLGNAAVGRNRTFEVPKCSSGLHESGSPFRIHVALLEVPIYSPMSAGLGTALITHTLHMA